MSLNTVSRIAGALALSAVTVSVHAAVSAPYKSEVDAWRAKAEKSLRADNGRLTLAGRHELHAGPNTVGTGKDNDVVLSPGLAPEHLGTILVEPDKVTLNLAPGVEMFNERTDSLGFSERTLQTDLDRRDWVYLGRMAFHVIKRDPARYILRVSDLESDTRRNFAGRIWYDVDPASRVPAKFVPYKDKTTEIVNVLGEVEREPVAGYLEFKWHGKTLRLDALADPGEPLFVIFRDGTADKTTYPAGRFLAVPLPTNGRTVIDFNKAYNPPCAFSAYTTCPLPPPQNVMKASVAAGEKFRPY